MLSRRLPQPNDHDPEPTNVPAVILDLHAILKTYQTYLRGHLGMLISLPLVGAVAGGAYAFVKPRVYDGALTVAVTRADRTDETAGAASFRPYLENNGIIDETMRKFKLDQPPFNLTRSRFLQDAYSVEPIRNTNLIVLHLSLADPDLVARTLNQIAARASELVRTTSSAVNGATRDTLKADLDEAQKRKDQADRELQAFKQRTQLELQRRDVDAILDQRGQLVELSVKIAQEQTRLNSAKAERDARSKTDTYTRTLNDDALSVAGAQAPNATGTAPPFVLKGDYVNQVYDEIDSRVAESTTELAALKEQLRQLVDVRKLDAPTLSKLNAYYEAEAEQSRLEFQDLLDGKVVDQIETAYQVVRTSSVDREAQITIIDPALPPDRPRARGTVTTLALGAALGLLLAVGILIVRETGRA